MSSEVEDTRGLKPLLESGRVLCERTTCIATLILVREVHSHVLIHVL